MEREINERWSRAETAKKTAKPENPKTPSEPRIADSGPRRTKTADNSHSVPKDTPKPQKTPKKGFLDDWLSQEMPESESAQESIASPGQGTPSEASPSTDQVTPNNPDTPEELLASVSPTIPSKKSTSTKLITSDEVVPPVEPASRIGAKNQNTPINTSPVPLSIPAPSAHQVIAQVSPPVKRSTPDTPQTNTLTPSISNADAQQPDEVIFRVRR